MNRVLQLNRRLIGSRRFLHFFKKNEIDEPAYHRKSLDPHALAIIRKYEDDIQYSSYLETNKKTLNYKQRLNLWKNLQDKDYEKRLNEARTTEPSIFIEKLRPKTADESKAAIVETQDKTNEKIETDEDKQRNYELTQSKLTILTELGLRRSALDYEAQSFPDNWMEDYETFNETETEVMAESNYGTPGKFRVI